MPTGGVCEHGRRKDDCTNAFQGRSTEPATLPANLYKLEGREGREKCSKGGGSGGSGSRGRDELAQDGAIRLRAKRSIGDRHILRARAVPDRCRAALTRYIGAYIPPGMPHCAVLIAVVLVPFLGAPLRAEQAAVTVFAAVSLKDALAEIEKEYEAGGGDDVTFSFGASGQLAAQIAEGAPADLFISAAEKQVKELIVAKLADAASRAVVASNRLVLVAPRDHANPVRSFSELSDARVKRIAIGQPRTVPAGEYATQALTKLKVIEVVRDRLVYGANVRQVLDYVARGEVDAGVVYATDAATAGEDVKVVATAEQSLHDPIVYPAVLITKSKHREAAERFLKHLQTNAAQAILRRRGFTAALGGAISAPSTRPSAAP